MHTNTIRSSFISLSVASLLLVAPAAALAQATTTSTSTATTTAAVATTTTTTPSADPIQAAIQALLNQIHALQQQLITLIQSRAASSTNPMGNIPGHPLTPGLCTQMKRTLVRGMRGDDVKGLQAKLIEDGFLSGDATGFFGEKTEEAVRHFQADMGIGSTTGAMGPRSRELFNQRCASIMGGFASSTPGMFPFPPRREGEGNGAGIGSSTRPFPGMPPLPPRNGEKRMDEGTSTLPFPKPNMDQLDELFKRLRPGSSTMPLPPLPPNASSQY